MHPHSAAGALRQIPAAHRPIFQDPQKWTDKTRRQASKVEAAERRRRRKRACLDHESDCQGWCDASALGGSVERTSFTPLQVKRGVCRSPLLYRWWALRWSALRASLWMYLLPIGCIVCYQIYNSVSIRNEGSLVLAASEGGLSWWQPAKNPIMACSKGWHDEITYHKMVMRNLTLVCTKLVRQQDSSINTIDIFLNNN